MLKFNLIKNQTKDNEKYYLRIKRKVQVLILLVSLMSGSLLMVGCSKANNGTENATISDNQDVTQEEPSTTTTPSTDEDTTQEEDNQETEENASEQEENGTDASGENETSTNPGENSENETQQQEDNAGQNTTEPFFATEEGTKLYDVVDAFTNAHLNQNNDVAKEYMAKDVSYEELNEGLHDYYKKVELIELKLTSYDETTKDGLLNYTLVLNGEDSYTYLTMNTVYEDGAYKISWFGLEK